MFVRPSVRPSVADIDAELAFARWRHRFPILTLLVMMWQSTARDGSYRLEPSRLYCCRIRLCR